MKRLLIYSSILVFFMACETGYKTDTNSTVGDDTTFNDRYAPKAEYIERESLATKFTGGVSSDGLDLGTIRVHEQEDSIRLVFDSYKWNETNEFLGEKVDRVGTYYFTYLPEKQLISAVIHGYRGFSAKLPNFSKDSLIEKIYFDEYLDDNGYRFFIKLRYDVDVKVFDLQNPGRVVADISML